MSEGVCGYSTVVGQSSYFIFEVGGILEASQFRSWALENKVGFKSLFGQWERQANASFIANMHDLQRIKEAGWLKHEQCYLELGPCDSRNHRDAFLVDLTGIAVPHRDYIGKFKPINWVEKKLKWNERTHYPAEHDWTYDPSTNTHYECVA